MNWQLQKHLAGAPALGTPIAVLADFRTEAGGIGYGPRFGLPGWTGKRPIVMNLALK
jgi:hypothetical protein